MATPEYRRNYYLLNKAAVNEHNRKNYRLHPDREAKRAKNYARSHRVERARYNRNYRKKLKLEVLTYYGRGELACVFCRENRIDCLSIDHINGNGMEHRRRIGTKSSSQFYSWLRRNKFPSGYQTLCINCQFSKYVVDMQPTSKINIRNLRARRKIKKQVLNHYCNGPTICIGCGENRLDRLSIDHIHGGGRKHGRDNNISIGHFYRWLRDNGFPEGFQVLCMNCQFIKEATNKRLHST